MAGLSKDRRTGIYLVLFYDPERKPQRKQVPSAVRDVRAAGRLRQFWEAEYAEGRYDPWSDSPPVPSTVSVSIRRAAGTLAETRTGFLASRAHRAANTRANYERVTGWFAIHAGETRLVASLTTTDVQSWIDSLDVKPVTRANYVRHLRAFFRYCLQQKLVTADLTEDVRLERVPRHFPKALRPEEIEAVVQYAEQHARDGQQRLSA